MSNKVALYTLGCKLNYSETSILGEQFIRNEFEVVDFNSHADVYVINTCTVTGNTDKECRQIIRRALRENPGAYIIVTGCYAQLKPEEIAGIGGVDLVLGTQEKLNLFLYAKNFEKRELTYIYVSRTNELNQFGVAFSSDSDSRTRAYFKIQDGCDYKCTFCTIPLARGKSRSLEPDNVYIQFNRLLEKGYKEIILTGVNIGDYGKSFHSKLDDLLINLVKIPGDFRIRVSSIEPNLLNEKIIELTASNKKMCKHFHIPLQSGSDKILKLMQRRYKRKDYEKLIYKLKDTVPDLGIGVDVIVGFPGETEEDFLETYSFLADLPISYLHVFTYSERDNTKAILMNNPVEVQERRRRNNELRILSEKKRFKFLNTLKGKSLQVLFEHENDSGFIKGYSSNYARVFHPYKQDLANTFSDIMINNVVQEHCSGNIIEKKFSVVEVV
jgi:threonylcarbamoyladenosine tRNA methylthiotransferase MtaB